MKLKNLLAYGILSVVLGACSYEPDEMVVEVDQSYPIQLFNEIEQVATTRVNDEGFCDGDGVGIYVVNYDGGVPGQLVVEGNQADNVRYVYDEANGKWIPNESVYFRDKNTHVDIIGYYPYGSPSSVDAYAFEVAKDQSTEAANGLLGGYADKLLREFILDSSCRESCGARRPTSPRPRSVSPSSSSTGWPVY